MKTCMATCSPRKSAQFAEFFVWAIMFLNISTLRFVQVARTVVVVDCVACVLNKYWGLAPGARLLSGSKTRRNTQPPPQAGIIDVDYWIRVHDHVRQGHPTQFNRLWRQLSTRSPEIDRIPSSIRLVFYLGNAYERSPWRTEMHVKQKSYQITTEARFW